MYGLRNLRRPNSHGATLDAYIRIKFNDAIKLLCKDGFCDGTNTTANFDAAAEVRLLEILGGGFTFVTHYPREEVAFYHADDPVDSTCALNADLLAPGYGELIGSGQRLVTSGDVKRKALHFKLPMEDYESYIAARDISSTVHSGWGMGIERLIHFITKLPSIDESIIFPRTTPC